MLYPIPTWLKNALLLILLFVMFMGMVRYADAPARSMNNLGDALEKLNVGLRESSPFVVPASGPVIVNGKKVWCPLTASYFVWMGVSGDGTQIVVTKDGETRNRVFVGSEGSGLGVFGATGIKDIESPVRITEWRHAWIDSMTHELTLPERNH